jgi:hypothetical protein
MMPDETTTAAGARGGIDRREAIQRVTFLLGGVALVGGTSLLTACEREAGRERPAAGARVGEFSAEDIALLDEVADTILPDTTKSPGAKAARTGAFMALMVTDTYDERQQRAFRDGMRTIDEESRKANGGATFVRATPQQRLTLLERLDREAKADADARMARGRAAEEEQEREAEQKAAAPLPDQRQEQAPEQGEANPAPGITTDAPPHYFRMMKELALLGYFTSEIGCTKALRYAETPGRYDPCAPYTPGEPAWAPHA